MELTLRALPYAPDDDEVEALAERIRLGDVSIWQELQTEIGAASTIDPGCRHCSDLEAEIVELREQAERQRREHARAVQTLQLERERERVQLATGRRQLDRELKELVAAIEAG